MELNKKTTLHSNHVYDVFLRRSLPKATPQYGANYVLEKTDLKIDLVDILLALHYRITKTVSDTVCRFKEVILNVHRTFLRKLLRIKTQGFDHIP